MSLGPTGEEEEEEATPTSECHEPSTLFVFWNDGFAPLEEEVRLACMNNLTDFVASDEGVMAEAPVRWVLSGRLNDARQDFVIWGEERKGPFDEQLTAALSGRELESVRKSRYWVGIETWLHRTRATEGWQAALRVASAVALPGLIAVYDENSGRVLSGRRVRDLVHCPAPPRARHLYSMQRIPAVGGTWLHTYGLTRAGVPELDLLGVPGDALAPAQDLLEAVADALLDGREPSEQGLLDLGEGLRLRALRHLDAANIIPEEWDRALSERETDGERYLLLDTVKPVAPLRLLSRTGSAPRTLAKSETETRRMRSLALSRFGTFGQLFAIYGESESWSFQVKLAHARRHSPEVREHLWFEVSGMKPGLLEVRLLSRPQEAIDLSVGGTTWQSLDRLTDWVIHCPSGTFDPECAPALLPD